MENKQNKNLIAIGILLILTFIFLTPILSPEKINNWGVRDWGLFQVGREVARQGAINMQIPLWDAYSCGGRPFIENPQHPLFNPSVILTVFFGTLPGVKITILIYFMLGTAGMFLLCRHLKLAVVASCLASAIFVFSSYFSLYLVEGHYWNVVWMLLPFIFYFFLKATEEIKFVIPAALFCVWMLFEGLSMGFVLTFVFLGIFSVLKAVQLKKARPLIAIGVLVLVVASIGAIKLLPQVVYVANNPRNAGATDKTAYDFEVFYNALTNRDQGAYDHNFPGQQNMAWAEYGMYIGFIVLILFFVGAFMYYKREWPLIATLLIFVIFAFGVNSPINLWNTMLSLPLFSSMKQAPRVKAYILFMIALFAAMALSRLERANTIKIGKSELKNIGKWVAVIIAVIVLVDLFLVSRHHLQEGFIIPPVPVQKSPEFYTVEAAEVPNPYTVDKVITQHYESNAGQKPYINLLAGLNTKNCYETIYYKRGGIARVIWNSTIMDYQENPNYRGEVFFESDVNAGRLLENATNKAHVESMDFQGFVLVADRISGEDFLILSQNYEKGWHVQGSLDNTVYERNGLIGVKVNQATTKVTLTYRPLSYVLGLWVTIFSLIFFTWLLIKWNKLKFTKKIDEMFQKL